jgi:hypothetical protein
VMSSQAADQPSVPLHEAFTDFSSWYRYLISYWEIDWLIVQALRTDIPGLVRGSVMKLDTQYRYVKIPFWEQAGAGLGCFF